MLEINKLGVKLIEEPAKNQQHCGHLICEINGSQVLSKQEQMSRQSDLLSVEWDQWMSHTQL